MRPFSRVLLAFAVVMVAAAPALSAGYLATKPTKLEKLVIGTDESGYGLSVTEYQMETGKAYSLEIESTGRKEYAFEAPKFFNFVWLRKIEAGDMEIKASNLYELEFEEEAECEIFFVPIKPGTYEFRIRGLEEKGMVGKFVVK